MVGHVTAFGSFIAAGSILAVKHKCCRQVHSCGITLVVVFVTVFLVSSSNPANLLHPSVVSKASMLCRVCIQAACLQCMYYTMRPAAALCAACRVTQTRAFDTEPASSSYASGFIVDRARGIILTNRHVVTPGAKAV